MKKVYASWEEVMRASYSLAATSPDPSSQTSAVLCKQEGSWVYVLASGVNCFPRGVDYTPERWERPLKYSVIEHAERNAIYQAASRGVQTQGLTMVAPWAACTNCARGIIQAGITTLITQRHGPTHPGWDEEIALADQMMTEAGVQIDVMEPITYCPPTPILRNGQLWQP